MSEIRCPGCMKEKQQRPVCEHCGYNENVPNYSHQLPIGTVLHGQYLVGKVLGQGGFGITYIGWDNSLQAPIAIKEYYPNSFVSRECAFSLDVHCAGEGAEEQFRHNRERFLREARILAKLQNVPGIVRVQNLFEENNTAYIVMEYVEGIDLKHYIRMQNRVLTVEETLSVMRPILYALHKVHEAELVHRDISPDNIMILPDGSAKLLDFGAAREVADAEVDKELPQSTEAILKHGFAPMEQYRRRGTLGPWTDVYALCATMYYCLTGKVPNSAPERILGDDNTNWKKVPGLSSQQIAVLENGMALVPENRVRTVKELHNGLYGQNTTGFTQVKKEEPKPEPRKQTDKKSDYPTHTVSLEFNESDSAVIETKKKKGKPIGLIVAALAVVAAFGAFAMKPKGEQETITAPEAPAAIATVSSVYNSEVPQDNETDYKIAMITDGGGIDDLSFNQITWEACLSFSEKTGTEVAWYQPSSFWEDASRVAAVDNAVADGCNIIVMPGYIFGSTIAEVSEDYPSVKFVALDVTKGDILERAVQLSGENYDYNPDNWELTDYVYMDNVYCTTYCEEQAGYMAGYAAVKLGYTKLGFLGGLAVPAVMRYGYGYLQGADAAAQELGIKVDMKYAYGNQFFGDSDITKAMDRWYTSGTEVVFACGGGIYTSVAEAAQKVSGKVIGVDVDQSVSIDSQYGSGMTITSAMKGLAPTVVDTLTEIVVNGNWSRYAGKIARLGLVSENPEKNYVQLPIETTKFEEGLFSKEDYASMVSAILDGTLIVSDDVSEIPNTQSVNVMWLGNLK